MIGTSEDACAIVGDGKPINNKGIVVAKESAIANEYWEEFKEKWQPTKNNPNPSLPIEVKPQAIK